MDEDTETDVFVVELEKLADENASARNRGRTNQWLHLKTQYGCFREAKQSKKKSATLLQMASAERRQPFRVDELALATAYLAYRPEGCAIQHDRRKAQKDASYDGSVLAGLFEEGVLPDAVITTFAQREGADGVIQRRVERQRSALAQNASEAEETEEQDHCSTDDNKQADSSSSEDQDDSGEGLVRNAEEESGAVDALESNVPDELADQTYLEDPLQVDWTPNLAAIMFASHHDYGCLCVRRVTLSNGHIKVYALAYNDISFEDLPIAARDVIEGFG